MQTKRIGDTILAWMPIPEHERSGRRAAERQAVDALLRGMGYDSDALGHTPHGAPVLPVTHISITHSRLIAMVALNPSRPIGIDAEEQRSTLTKVRHKFVTPDEEKWAKESDLLRLWTVKEAVYKVAGKRDLPFTSIDTRADWSAACADGVTYDLIFLQLGKTSVCLSTKSYSH